MFIGTVSEAIPKYISVKHDTDELSMESTIGTLMQSNGF